MYLLALFYRVSRDVWQQSFASDGITPIPLERWDPDGALATQLFSSEGSTPLRFGSFLSADTAAAFDAAAFGLSATEASLMDPQQRLLLEATADVMLPLGSTAGVKLGGQGCGVFVGISSMDYQKLSSRYGGGVTAYSATGVSLSVAAGRVSYTFGFTGPALAVDTACSSALVAAHSAGLSMKAGGCSTAAAAGANLTLYPDTPAMFKRAGMLAEDGRCKTLDAAADGYVRAEAVGVMLLQLLDSSADSAAVGQLPLAILYGSAVNQDGRSSSLTAPNGPAQQEVIRAALKAGGLNPSQVTALSLHGTGTSLGDPIELGAAAEVLVDGVRREGNPLLLLSSKSWLGHAEPAAGIVGIQHAQHLMTQQLNLPVAHLTSLNPYVERVLEVSAAGAWSLPRQLGPLAVARRAAGSMSSGLQLLQSEQQALTSCGVSAFAFQGTNAHIIMAAPAAASGGGLVAPNQDGTTLSTHWERSRYWLQPRAYGTIGSAAVSGFLAQKVIFSCQLAAGSLASLQDHIVSGRCILPAAGFLEAAAAAGKSLLLLGDAAVEQQPRLALTNVSIPVPLLLGEVRLGVELQVVVHPATGELLVKSVAAAAPLGAVGTVHLEASLELVKQQQPVTADQLQRAGDVLKLMELVSWVKQVVAMKGASVGALETECAEFLVDHVLHPALLDCTFQLGLAASSSSGKTSGASSVKVPAGIDAFVLPAGATSRAAWAASSSSGGGRAAEGSSRSHYWMLGADGGVISSVSGLVAKAISKVTAPAGGVSSQQLAAASALQVEPLYQVVWAASKPEAVSTLGTADGLTGYSYFPCKPQTQEGCALIDAAAVQMSLLQQQPLMGPMAANLFSNLCGYNTSCRGHGMGSVGVDMAWGMLRSGVNEGSVHLASVHDADLADQDESKAVQYITSAEQQTQSQLYGGRLQGRVLQEAALLEAPVTTTDRPYHLIPQPPGSFSSLVPAAVDVSPGSLAAGQVGVRVQAVGLNFRDVLNVLGMYPGDPGAPGGDCAGVVVSSSASSLCPGQSVFGLAVGSLGSAVVCAADTLMVMPSSISYEEAASMPTVFITAHKALADVTAVQPGESVLVHAAAGGVGLAASQVLAGLGAVCVATGGSPSKRVLLRGLGVGAVVGSRDSSFVEPLAQLGGCDVLLNSLTSPGMVAASMALIKQGGRMAEIGKRDIWSAAAAAAERPDVSYNLLAVDFLPGGVVQTALQKVAAGVAAGMLRPLPTIAHELSSVVAAFRQMSQARHVGKITISPSPAQKPSVHLPGLVVITGGMGTLGSLVAQWMVQQGCKHLVLLGRTGRFRGEGIGTGPEISRGLAELTCVAADISCKEDLERVLLQLPVEMGLPVAAVMHAGGVLADATVSKQSLAGLREVMAPKLLPLLRWQQLLGCQPVAQQVLFSSVASLLGSPGQSNYAAANAGLDGAAGVLSAAGLGVVSCQWGAWAGAGMAAQDASTAARVARSGMELLQPQQGLAALSDVLAMLGNAEQPTAALAAVPFRWPTFLKGSQASQQLFAEFKEQVDSQQQLVIDRAAADVATRVARRHLLAPFGAAVQERVKGAVASILGRDVGADEPLVAAGLDSLGAVELRNKLQVCHF